MIGKIFGKKPQGGDNGEFSQLKERIGKMNLSEMNLYVKGKLEGLPPSEEGIIQVLMRLVSKINAERYFLDPSDDDSKLKKAFDVVLHISKNKMVTLKAMELIANFFQLYESLIHNYDKKYKEIYAERFKKAIDDAMEIIEAKVSLQNRMNILE